MGANLMIVLFSATFFVYTNAQLIVKMHFDHSLDYLYTGVQYDSQYGERPGLAKKLRGMSDSQWEAGMDALNKYLEHGGSTDAAFVSKLHFKGGETASLTK